MVWGSVKPSETEVTEPLLHPKKDASSSGAQANQRYISPQALPHAESCPRSSAADAHGTSVSIFVRIGAVDARPQAQCAAAQSLSRGQSAHTAARRSHCAEAEQTRPTRRFIVGAAATASALQRGRATDSGELDVG